MAATRLAEPFGNAAGVIREHARSRPAHRAIVHGERVLDYGALDAFMDRVAAALQRDRVEPRESIAICAATSPEYLGVFLGALRAGVAVAPLQPSVAPRALAAMVEDSGARIVFLDRAAGRSLQ